jgi:hypothetical protein
MCLNHWMEDSDKFLLDLEMPLFSDCDGCISCSLRVG